MYLRQILEKRIPPQVTRTPMKSGVELRCSGRVDRSCSTSTNQSYLRGLCPRNGPKVTLTYLSMFLITLSNDVNINPEPSTSDSLYPCGTCDKPVTWDDRGIVCDTCNQWYHANCQSMKSSLYLEHVNDCCSLGLPCLQLPQL
jgi:hypothetical protein